MHQRRSCARSTTRSCFGGSGSSELGARGESCLSLPPSLPPHKPPPRGGAAGALCTVAAPRPEAMPPGCHVATAEESSALAPTPRQHASDKEGTAAPVIALSPPPSLAVSRRLGAASLSRLCRSSLFVSIDLVSPPCSHTQPLPPTKTTRNRLRARFLALSRTVSPLPSESDQETQSEGGKRARERERGRGAKSSSSKASSHGAHVPARPELLQAQ
jgi:hypothetical protein